jgi:hypothetical protein
VFQHGAPAGDAEPAQRLERGSPEDGGPAPPAREGHAEQQVAFRRGPMDREADHAL